MFKKCCSVHGETLLRIASICFLAAFFSTFGYPIDDWTQITVDENRTSGWELSFGSDAADLDEDGDLDILTGKYLYINPGGTMEGSWQKRSLGKDGVLFVDANSDGMYDIIAEEYPYIYLFVANDRSGGNFSPIAIADNFLATEHTNCCGAHGQGHRKAMLFATDAGLPQILLSHGAVAYGNSKITALEIPASVNDTWPQHTIADPATDEEIGIGDIDGDGAQAVDRRNLRTASGAYVVKVKAGGETLVKRFDINK